VIHSPAAAGKDASKKPRSAETWIKYKEDGRLMALF
jgi:hypothetical protein